MSAPRTRNTPQPPQSGAASANPVAVSTNGTTVSTLTINTVRLPIGHSAQDPRPDGPRTLFWLVIPTNAGGRLTCDLEGGGTLTLLAADQKTRLGSSSKQDGKLSVVIPPKTHGLMYVVAEGAAPRKVTSHFVQVGLAREGASDKDRPLIPWNFWYYPSARTFLDGTRNSGAGEPEAIIRKYVHAVKTDPKEATDFAEKAGKWEHDNHGVDVGPKWRGHCHNSAGASIVFEQPVAKTVNGQSFTEDELELIAAELFGNLGNPSIAFALRGTALTQRPPRMFSGRSPAGLPFETQNDDEVREAPPVIMKGHGSLYYPMCFKPAEVARPNATMLAQALLAFDPSLGNAAIRLARQAFATMDVPQLLRDWFGELAAQFYFALVECILKGKHALEGDLASTEPSSGPEEVWNHAVFHYSAEFVETPRTNDWNDITLTIDLTANDDFRRGDGSSSGAPAVPTPDGGVDFKSSQNRRSRQILRVVFDSTGEVTFDSRNAWISSRNQDIANMQNPLDPVVVDAEVYAPRYLAWMQLDFSEGGLLIPPKLGAESRGNPVVQLDAVSGKNPLLTFRKRFRP